MTANEKNILRIFQKGFNYSQDGKGNRLVLHLQGCNMRCPWCANPEGMPMEGVLMTDREWLLPECCPHGAVKDMTLNRDFCKSCTGKECIRKYRQKGIRLSYKSYTVDEIVEECENARPMFFDGGGVTLTGGEATMQLDGVKELLQKLGERHIHRAIETNGSHTRISELYSLVDEWIMDVKHYDDRVHKEWIGISNERVIKTMQEVTRCHSDVLIRVPLIQGFNDSPADAEGFAALFEKKLHPGHAKVEFLLYHEFGKDKWTKCGMTYRMTGNVEENTREYFENVMASRNIPCTRT